MQSMMLAMMYLCHLEKGMNDRIVISRMRYVFLKENNVLQMYKKSVNKMEGQEKGQVRPLCVCQFNGVHKLFPLLAGA